MSEFLVRVVEIGEVEKHPNADSLSITQVDGGYPVIFRTGEYQTGDRAVYVPIDSVMPDTEQWAFLQGHRRIKAKKLRGVFSMGMLAPLPRQMDGDALRFYEIGENVQELMGIVKYEPALRCQIVPGDSEPEQTWFPRYTDIEGLRKHGGILQEGEPVVLTEKIHGANGRWTFHEGRLWTGSHNRIIKRASDGERQSIWWQAAIDLDLEGRLANTPGFALYGEVYGKVQDLGYGLGERIDVRFFDALDLSSRRYLNADEFRDICFHLGLETVPVLYEGPWSEGLRSLAEGPTTLGGRLHTREGFVVRPLTERFDRRCGRVVLKHVGEGYLLRKGA